MQLLSDHRRQQPRGIRRMVCHFVVLADLCSRVLAQDPAVILETSVTKIVEKNEAAVVSIARFRPSLEMRIEQEKAAHKPLRLPRDTEAISELELLPNEFGTGLLISPLHGTDRYILTNYHVVRGGAVYPNANSEDGTILHVHFSDRRKSVASIIAADPRSDLAVLRVQWEQAKIRQTDYPTLNWTSSAPAKKGQFVVLLGNPYAIARDGSASVSWGMVSNLTRQPIIVQRNSSPAVDDFQERSGLSHLGTMLQLDARLNLGTSGGPVLNLNGELIGISSSLAGIEGYEQSTGFAFPIDPKTRHIVATLLNGQEVEYGMIGISPKNLTQEQFAELENGLPLQSATVVREVTLGAPAFVAGIRANDVIIGVNGEVVRSPADLMRLVGLNPPGAVISVTVCRKNHPVETVKIKLCKWPATDDEGIIETNPRYKPWRGLSVDFATARFRFMTPDSHYSPRVLVTKVVDGSPTYSAKIQVGNYVTHVNKIPIETPAEFYSAIKTASGTVSLTLSEPNHQGEGERIVEVYEEEARTPR